MAYAAGVNAWAHDAPAQHLGVLVIDRHRPTNHVETAEEFFLFAIFRGVGVQAQVGQDLVLYTNEHMTVVRATSTGTCQTTATMHWHKMHVGRNFHRGRTHFIKGGALEMLTRHLALGVQSHGVIVVG